MEPRLLHHDWGHDRIDYDFAEPDHQMERDPLNNPRASVLLN
jgi:hypothetical protein